MQPGLAHFQKRAFGGHWTARLHRMLQRLAQEFSGQRLGLRHQVLGIALRDHAPAEPAGARAEVDHVVRSPDSVLVVLHDDQRVALGFQLLQHVEQDAVVSVVQADGRLVKDVAHAAQVGAELRGEPDALRLPAGKRRRRAVQRQVAQTHLAEEGEARLELRQDVSRNFTFAPGDRDLVEELLQVLDRPFRVVRDVPVAPAHRERLGVQALAAAGFARFVDLQPLDPRIEHVVFGAGARALVAPLHFLDLESGAVAGGTPAVLGVVREKARVELGEAAAAGSARALGGEHLDVLSGLHVHHAFAELERPGKPVAQLLLAAGRDFHVAYRQLDGVLDEAVKARERTHGEELAVDPQLRIALARRPLGEIGVEALAVHDERR